MTASYVITIGTQLDERWSSWFAGLTITNGPHGHATLAGPLADQAALHGVLATLRDLGIPLLAVQPVPPDEVERSVATDLPAN